MGSIYCFSGPCGCGKTTLSAAFAQQLAQEKGQVYLLHGDDFHAGFIGDGQSPGALPWPEILRFNWAYLLSVAGEALARGLDVVLDYVVEDELPLIRQLAQAHDAALYYIVLTASEEAIASRLAARGDAELTGRALFLRDKLTRMPENQGHILDNTGLSVPEELALLDLPRFLLPANRLLQTDIDNPPPHGVS